MVLTYKSAGVDIDAGNRLVSRIAPLAASTRRPELLAGLGGFAALCAIPAGYTEPVLVSGTDGVGTKLKLAQQFDRHDTVGVDLVAMCVNDVLVCGAEPLFFLDYFATGVLEVHIAEQVIAGIAKGCVQAGASLAGGETAEMPGMYAPGEYDLAGFCVGVVEKSRIIRGEQVRPGDVLIGLASSGPHANGFSLIRKIVANVAWGTQVDGQPLADLLLAPTRIYVKAIRELCRHVPIGAMAHITGGGLAENLPRVLPEGVDACLDPQALRPPPLFNWLQTQGQVPDEDMWRTFNIGVGYVVCCASEHVSEALDVLHQSGERAWVIGQVRAAEGPAQVVWRT